MADAILIVGDWVVDEYWFLVRHYSDISSHTGFIHYRLACQPEDVIFDLCGAGHFARVLYELKESDDLHIVGLGKWHKLDADFVKHILHSRAGKRACEATQARFILQSCHCQEGFEDLHLVTLDGESKTIRVIREYHKYGKGLRQINRVDWELESTSDFKFDLRPLDKEPLSTLNVKFIVVQDLMKGVFDRDGKLITELDKRFPEARWFVRSKRKNGVPRWLKSIAKKLELLVIGPENLSLLAPWDNWLFNDRLTHQAFQQLNNPLMTEDNEHLEVDVDNVMLLSDRFEIACRLGAKVLTACVPSLPNEIEQLGWPDATIASVVHQCFTEHPQKISIDVVERALGPAYRHRGILVPDTSEQSDQAQQPTSVPFKSKSFKWVEEKSMWRQATNRYGIIGSGEKLQLDVWRGLPQLPGYVNCIQKKQEVITRIGKYLRAFKKSGTPPGSLSIMLQADPGAGKTYLAKCLAEAFDFAFIRFEVTQMLHRDDLLDLFDSVATLQANEKEKDILVLVDEINALLDGGHAYGAFLAPLEEGFYVRHGNSFNLRPCVWLFAGTNLQEDKTKAGEKLSDFKSRMTLIEKIDYASLRNDCPILKRRALAAEAKLEQVYLGATMIKNRFPDVRKVSEEVLAQFHNLDPAKAPARTIRRLVASLKNVQYGKVTRDNCSDWGVAWKVGLGSETPVKLIFE